MNFVATVIAQVSWYEWILVGGGLLTALGAFWVKIIVPVYNLIKTVESFYPIVPTITAVAKELETSSITEIKSDVKKIGRHLNEISSELCELRQDTHNDVTRLKKCVDLNTKTLKGLTDGSTVASSKKYFGFIKRG